MGKRSHTKRPSFEGKRYLFAIISLYAVQSFLGYMLMIAANNQYENIKKYTLPCLIVSSLCSVLIGGCLSMLLIKENKTKMDVYVKSFLFILFIMSLWGTTLFYRTWKTNKNLFTFDSSSKDGKALVIINIILVSIPLGFFATTRWRH